MHPFRPPFGVPSRPTNPNAIRPNTTQPLPTFNLQDYDTNTMGFSQLLNMSQNYFQGPMGFAPNMSINVGSMSGSQPEQEPDIDRVPDTQPEQEPDNSQRRKRSHKKREMRSLVHEGSINRGAKTRSTRLHGLG